MVGVRKETGTPTKLLVHHLLLLHAVEGTHWDT